MTTPSALLASLGHPRILVLGDLILDRYTFGNAERVSPEAPVVVLRVDGKEVRLGGAASVALLLRGLMGARKGTFYCYYKSRMSPFLTLVRVMIYPGAAPVRKR